MKIVKVADYEEMSRVAAELLAEQVKQKPDSVLGLATGGTPVRMYQELVELHQKEGIDFSEVKTFNLDEYYGLDKNNEQSYAYYMWDNLFSHINIKEENTHIPNGKAKDISTECASYERAIREAGGVDLQILGIGANGHIGFNEPDDNFEAVTHLVELEESTIEANARFFESIEEVPTKAISMGIKTILNAEKIILLANGESKAKALQEMISGKITPEVPASILQLHKDLTIVIDQEAGSCL